MGKTTALNLFKWSRRCPNCCASYRRFSVAIENGFARCATARKKCRNVSFATDIGLSQPVLRELVPWRNAARRKPGVQRAAASRWRRHPR